MKVTVEITIDNHEGRYDRPNQEVWNEVILPWLENFDRHSQGYPYRMRTWPIGVSLLTRFEEVSR